MKLRTWLLCFCLWSCLQPLGLLACKYNVRDLGFVDLGDEAYTLFCCVRNDTPAQTLSQLTATARTALGECNIRLELVNADQQTNHPAMQHLKSLSPASFPAAVLVSPDGQAMPVTLSKPGQLFRDTLPSALEDLAASPKRQEILRAVSRAFAAVLLIEGESPAGNRRARAAIAQAIDQIRAQMKGLPKVIAEPPALIVLNADSLAREKVLLWSLGLDATAAPQPRAALLYGKARWLGPLMKGEEITEPNLTGILSIIGADCECGLDISWTLGTRLPVRWDEKVHAQVARALGFDPESPLVKLEAGRIMGRRAPAPAAPAGYQAALPGAASSTARQTPLASHLEKTTGAAQSRAQAAPLPVSSPSASVSRRLLLFMGGLAVLMVSAGLLALAWWASKKRWE